MTNNKRLFKAINKTATYIYEWFSQPARARGQVSLPTALNFPITDNCNSRCIMCDVWKTRSNGEPGVEDWRPIFSDKLFSEIKHVGISGGEPTLRNDLIEMIILMIDSFPKFKSLSITTHGYHTKRWKRILPIIKRHCKQNNIDLRINISVDGFEDVHDQVRAIPGGFNRLMNTFQDVRKNEVEIQLQSTISHQNVYNVGRILHHSTALESDIIFRQATEIARLDNEQSITTVALDDNQKSFFADFLLSNTLMSRTFNPARRLFYRDLAKRLVTGRPRKAPCYFQSEAVLLTAHGDLYHCSIVTDKMGNVFQTNPYNLYFSEESRKLRQNMLLNICPSCVHDQSGAWSPLDLILESLRNHASGKKIFRVIEGLKLVADQILNYNIAFFQLLNGKPLALPQKSQENAINSTSNEPTSALVVGAYGGEHVGDAAILGGVLLRIHRTYGIDKVTIVSLRPDRTKRWVQELVTSVQISVIANNPASIKKVLPTVDYVVYGGGPIMDLPLILIPHLATVLYAQYKQKPFVMEGVGVGPFKSRLMEKIASLLISRASYITLRTSRSFDSKLLNGINKTLSKDPAFDYLNTRNQLDNIGVNEKIAIDGVLTGASNTIVALNLRPLWDKYLAGVPLASGINEQQIVNLVANALKQFSRNSAEAVTYVFFPMNTDQFGFSDLAIAYTLADILAETVDFRIIEYELGIDGALYFLRRASLAVTMRFHASIFALSQNVPTIGLDYMIGKQGKVGELFQDLGISERCNRIDLIDEFWLINRLQDLQGVKNLPSTNSSEIFETQSS